MNLDEALNFIERVLLPRQLDPIEKFVFQQSWLGRTYDEMARDCGYGSNYIKEIGSQLWQDLSRVIGERVSKKNLQLVLSRYEPNRTINLPNSNELTLQGDIETESPPPHLKQEVRLEFPSGPLPFGSSLYINRPPVEDLVLAEISQPGCIVRIKAPEKMGKTSLLNHIIAQAKARGYSAVSLDLKEADETAFSSLDKFLRWFSANVSRSLNLTPTLEEYWDKNMGSKVSCKIYFEQYILKQITSPLVLALDEVNRVFQYLGIAQDFLSMLRSWHEQAKVTEIWQNLRLMIAHATEVYLPFGFNQSPFNVGVSVTLPPFTLEQVQHLTQQYGLEWAINEVGAQCLAPLYAMVGGHPYLVSIALYHLAQEEITLEELLQTAPTSTGIYNHHLRSHLTTLLNEPQVASAMRQVVMANEGVQLDAIAAYKLKCSGLIELDGNLAKPSCELYRLYFQAQLEAHYGTSDRLQPLELKLEQQEPQPLPHIANLTQLADRHFFKECLDSGWQQWMRETTLVSLMICEIDYFKFFNDAYGATTGDACLQEIAITIQDCINYQATLLARYGSAEFALIFSQVDIGTVADFAETIRKRIKALGIVHDQSRVSGFPAQVITASVGVATTVPNPKISPTDLITEAEKALYQAKRQGRDRVNQIHLVGSED